MMYRINKIALVIYVAALTAFAPFSTDIYLSSMPIIQHEFSASVAAVQLTLSLFFVSFGLMQLFWGPLSDRIGRKAVILISAIVFVMGSQLCAHSTSIFQLIMSRIIQSVGASAGMIMSMAIVKDRFPDNKHMSAILSIMTSISILAPMIAPTIGSYLLVHFGWHSNFYFLSLYGGVLIIGTLFTRESLPAKSRIPLPMGKLCAAYLEQLKQPLFLLAILSISTNFSIMFSFIATSSFIYINLYHLRPELFGYFFVLNAVALTCGSLSLKILKKKLIDSVIIKIAATLSVFGAFCMILAILKYPLSIYSVVIGSFIVTYGVGILYPELTTYALKNVTNYTGIASSLIGTVRFIMAAMIGFLTGMSINTNALPLAIIMLLLSLCTYMIMILYFKRSSEI